MSMVETFDFAGKSKGYLREEMGRLSAEAKAIGAKGDDATLEEHEAAREKAELAHTIKERLEAASKGMRSADEMDRWEADLRREARPPTLPGQAPLARTDDRPPVPAMKSFGERIVEADGFKSWRPGVKQTIAFGIDGYQINETKATLTSGVLTSYDRQPGVLNLQLQRLTIADLLSQARTVQPTIRYWRENTFTNAATSVAEEGQKPEATFDVVETDAAVRKIAVIAKMSDELMADFPAIADYANNRLRFMVEEREDRLLYSGNGTAPNIRGLTQTVGIQTEASASAADNLDAIHRAITKVRAVGFFEPDGIVMHPTDYQKLRLAKDGNGQYFGGGPFYSPYAGSGGVQMNLGPWGLPVVITTGATVGTALVGAFRLGATIFRRQGITIDMTNSNEDDFEYNRITIRAEERLALVVWRPLAFCTVTGLA